MTSVLENVWIYYLIAYLSVSIYTNCMSVRINQGSKLDIAVRLST
jgi:hypothetical protein